MVFIKNCLWIVEIALFANIVLLITGVEPRNIGVLLISIGLIILIEVYSKSPSKNGSDSVVAETSSNKSKFNCSDINCDFGCGDACEVADLGFEILDCLDL